MSAVSGLLSISRFSHRHASAKLTTPVLWITYVFIYHRAALPSPCNPHRPPLPPFPPFHTYYYYFPTTTTMQLEPLPVPFSSSSPSSSSMPSTAPFVILGRKMFMDLTFEELHLHTCSTSPLRFSRRSWRLLVKLFVIRFSVKVYYIIILRQYTIAYLHCV